MGDESMAEGEGDMAMGDESVNEGDMATQEEPMGDMADDEHMDSEMGHSGFMVMLDISNESTITFTVTDEMIGM